MHLLLKITMNEKKMTCHPILKVNQCICDLTRNEDSLAYLHDVDVLIIEEIGVLHSEMCSTIELVLQHVMDNDSKAGERLVISNRNPHQLKNTTKSKFWLYNHLAFHFDVALLHHYVRFASDPILQKILQLLRKIKPLDEDEKIGLAIAF